MRLTSWRRSVFLSARRRAGLSDRFRVHDLRHTAASLMIQAGYPPKMLQEIMGHASITTTLDLYGHLYPGEMDRYADRPNEAAGITDAAQNAARRLGLGSSRARCGGSRSGRSPCGGVGGMVPWYARDDQGARICGAGPLALVMRAGHREGS